MKKYLTPELKEYYMNDFKDNVITCTNENWKLDDGVLHTLTEINKSADIQCIYSRRCSNEEAFRSEENSSYIALVITEPLEEKMNTIAERLKKKYGEQFEMFVNEPIEKYPMAELREQFQEGDSALKMGCCLREDYFNITVFMPMMCSYDLRLHAEFWADLHTALTNIR